MDIIWAGVAELGAGLRSGRITVERIAETMIGRIETVNPSINAIVHHDPDQIIHDARELDDRLAHGRPSSLFGIPYTVKELTPVAGVPHTLGFERLKGNIARHDALVVQRLRAAGALYLGQTNAPEAGYCATTTNRLFGTTRNPWDTRLTPGGSSGGAGAAVAAGLGPIAEGTDAGGSIRVPAAFTGVVGFKPSTGRIPHTLLPQRFATSLTHGVLGRTVADVRAMYDVVSGHDARDPLSVPGSPEPVRQDDLSGWTVAYSADLGLAGVDPEVAAICREAIGVLTDLGARVVEDRPDWRHLDEAIWDGILLPSIAGLRGLLDWPAQRGHLADELVDLVLRSDDVRAADIARAEARRGGIWDSFAGFMTSHRLLVSPTTTVAAFPADRFAPDEHGSLRDRLIGWSLTYPYNLTASPAISVPCGFTRDGRPVGLQIAGRRLADEDVLHAAAVFESRVSPRHWPGP